jgi:hypothetical protein
MKKKRMITADFSEEDLSKACKEAYRIGVNLNRKITKLLAASKAAEGVEVSLSTQAEMEET